MNSETVIHLKNVNKTFWIREKSTDTLRQRFKNIVTGKNKSKEVRALVDVNIDIFKGEFFGIVGHNGSGKSTLLKLIIGGIKPDKGSIIKTNGKVLRLALGMGFDPNLSARHNIYVNGSIMGLTFKEIGRKYAEIIDFAELEDFMDTPLKFFSSGMVSRLAFAISVHVESEILLIDEFFGGVGDVSFKEKSERIFEKRILEGKTVMFVSHTMDIIKKYCHRVCVLDHGKMVNIGAPDSVIPVYIESYKN